MPRARKCAVWLVCAAIWSTGVIWLFLHFFAQTKGAFGAEVNPAEIWILRAHGAAAFASLWLLGLLWAVHIPPGWTSKRRGNSGALLFVAAIALRRALFLAVVAGRL